MRLKSGGDLPGSIGQRRDLPRCTTPWPWRNNGLQRTSTIIRLPERLERGGGVRLINRLMAPICGLAAIAGAPAYAEEPAAKAPSAVQSATAPLNAATEAPVNAATRAPAPTTPPPVDRKKALQLGFRPGVEKGIPVFCKEVPIEGTRFTNRRCVREDQFSAYLSQLQVARDAARKNGCYGGAFCGSLETMPGKPRMSMGSNK